MSVKKVLNFATFGLLSFVPGKVGKVLRGAVLVAAGVITGQPGLIMAGLSMGLSAFKKNSAPSQAQARLQASFNPNEPRKIVLGHTAGETDVRYQAYTGADQAYLEQIIAIASHECEGEAELWFDDKKAWSEAGGVTADYTGYLTVAIRNPGTRVNGIAIDATWTADCTLTGCCYLHVKYKLTGNTKKAESPFANGVPSRMTIRIKGAKVPDLRVAGVDPDDQTTWVYSDAGSDSGRNPAWARLFYEIGWRINGKLAVGRGIPSNRLNLDSYTTAANHCDETVALDAGGSEPRYRHDMAYSEGEGPGSVLSNINAAMNAFPTDDGGRIGIVCLHDDLGDPDILEFTDDDIASGGGNEKWNPDERISDSVNIARGQYTDPSDTGLYQMAPETEVALGDAAHDFGSLDGIQRIAPFAAPQIQSPTQWTRLAKLRLLSTQQTGVYRVNVKAKGWRARMLRPVTFSHRARGWEGKTFRVVGMGMPTGIVVPLVLKETSSAEFDWDETIDEPTVITATPPTGWDPTNDPVVGGIDDAGATADWSLIVDDNGNRPDDNATVGAAWGTDLTGRPTELTDGRVSAALDSSGDLARNVTSSRANSSNLFRYTGGGLYVGDLNATAGAAWASNVTGRPTELTDGRVSAGLDSSGDLNRNIGSGRANTSNLLRYAAGGLYAGDLNATVGAAWGSNVTGRPTELTDGRVSAALDSSGDLARNVTSSRANSSNLFRYTGGGLYVGDLNATAGAAWGSNVTGRPTELTDGRVSAGLDSSGDLNRNIGSGRANTSNLLRYTAGGLYAGDLAATSAANLLINGKLASDASGWSVSGGLTRVAGSGTGDPPGYFQYSNLASSGTADALNSTRTQVNEGDRYEVAFKFSHSGAGTGRQAIGWVDWYNAAGTFISTTTFTAKEASGTGWTQFRDGSLLAPANAAGGDVVFRLRNLTGGTLTTSKIGDFVFQRLGALSQSGSGAQLGDSNVLPANVTYGLLPSLKDAVTISDTYVGPTVTINIGSAVFYPDVGGTVTFPSGSVAGKALATKYYIKRTGVTALNPTGTGWDASTTLTIGLGDVYVNSYTTRATSGTPSPPPPPPPGGGGDCVVVSSWLPGHGQADAIVAGDALRALDYQTMNGDTAAIVTGASVSLQPCFEIRTACGYELELSESAPLTVRSGETVAIADAIGQLVPVGDDDAFEGWDEIVACRYLGLRLVAHLHAGGATFAAGKVRGRYIYTHNANKP